MTMKRSLCFFALGLAVLLGSCKSRGTGKGSDSDSLQGEVNISGAFALYPMCLLWAEEFQEANPGVTVNISGGGAGKGMTDALNDMVDFGMISREIKQAEIDKGAWFIAVARDAVVPTINPGNPVYPEVLKRGLTREQLYKIFISGEIKRWNQLYPDFPAAPDEAISVYTRSDACGAAETFAAYLGGHQDNLKGIGVNGDPGMASTVQKDLYGIGYNNLGFAYDLKTRKPIEGLGILPLDINADGKVDASEQFYSDLDSLSDAIGHNRYPAPPARNLYLSSKGVPKNPAAKAFARYILTKGQSHVKVGGYVALPEEICALQLEKLGMEEDEEPAVPDTALAQMPLAD